MKYFNHNVREKDGAWNLRIGPYHEAGAGEYHHIDFLFIHWLSLGDVAVLEIGPWKHTFDHRPPELR